MPDTSYVKDLEAGARVLRRQMFDTVQRMRGVYGDRPMGTAEPSRWDRLEHYLALYQDPAAWQQMIDLRAQQVGRLRAIGEAIASDIQLGTLLDAAGGWQGVQMHQAEARGRAALRAMERVTAWAELPPFTVRDPLPPQATASPWQPAPDAGGGGGGAAPAAGAGVGMGGTNAGPQ